MIARISQHFFLRSLLLYGNHAYVPFAPPCHKHRVHCGLGHAHLDMFLFDFWNGWKYITKLLHFIEFIYLCWQTNTHDVVTLVVTWQTDSENIPRLQFVKQRFSPVTLSTSYKLFNSKMAPMFRFKKRCKLSISSAISGALMAQDLTSILRPSSSTLEPVLKQEERVSNVNNPDIIFFWKLGSSSVKQRILVISGNFSS